jgi:alkanesulfonate monooxygenase SsuD/methylene tetrahydromethanopterin reductase-like flavin-dependent oxidoreductase (luciferase family)
MRRGVIGRNDAEVNAKLNGADKAALLERGGMVGTASEVVDLLEHQSEAGVQGVILQWLDLDDISGLEYVAAEVLPQVR